MTPLDNPLEILGVPRWLAAAAQQRKNYDRLNRIARASYLALLKEYHVAGEVVPEHRDTFEDVQEAWEMVKTPEGMEVALDWLFGSREVQSQALTALADAQRARREKRTVDLLPFIARVDPRDILGEKPLELVIKADFGFELYLLQYWPKQREAVLKGLAESMDGSVDRVSFENGEWQLRVASALSVLPDFTTVSLPKLTSLPPVRVLGGVEEDELSLEELPRPKSLLKLVAGSPLLTREPVTWQTLEEARWLPSLRPVLDGQYKNLAVGRLNNGLFKAAVLGKVIGLREM